MFFNRNLRHRIAVDDYTRALQLNPNHAWILYQRGLSYLQLRRFQEALSDLERAGELNPRYHAPHLIWKCQQKLAA
jgi:tetratricopeptide (TPR) repeat protein